MGQRGERPSGGHDVRGLLLLNSTTIILLDDYGKPPFSLRHFVEELLSLNRVNTAGTSFSVSPVSARARNGSILMLKWLTRFLGSREENRDRSLSRVITVPKALYRYRALNDYTLSSLRENNVYLARPSELNDVLDGRFYVLPRKLSAEEEARLQAELQRGNRFARQFTKSPDSGEYSYGSSNTVVDDMGFTDSLFRSLKESVEGPSIECGICCFSETPVSVPMWAHYGDNHRGICIEYSATDLLFRKLNNKEFSLFPVNYLERLVHLDPMQLLLNEERVILETIAQYKSPEWSYEMEWRLIGPTGGHVMETPFTITKVVFGNRVTANSVGRVVSALGIDANVSYYICFVEKEQYGLRIVPAEWAFGPIIHVNSIFQETRQAAQEQTLTAD